MVVTSLNQVVCLVLCIFFKKTDIVKSGASAIEDHRS